MKKYKNKKTEENDKVNSNFKEISLVNDLLFWRDSLSKNEVFYDSIYVRTFNNKEAKPQNLTNECYLMKSSFHGYGGKNYKCIQLGDKFYLFWIDQITRTLFYKIFKKNINSSDTDNKYLLEIQPSRALLKNIEGNLDANFALLNNRVFGIYERNNIDYLIYVDLNKDNHELKIVKQFDAFAGFLSTYSGNDFFSWLEWGNYEMPWQNNNLIVAKIYPNAEIKILKSIKKIISPNQTLVSFFQPYWISEKIVICSEDSSGWWNLLFLEIDNTDNIFIKKKLTKNHYEYGTPQWVSDISLFSGTDKHLFCLAKSGHDWVLEEYQNLEFKSQIKIPFSILNDLHSFKNKVVLKASCKKMYERLLEFDVLDSNKELGFIQSGKQFFDKTVSQPESFYFKGYDRKLTHSWIYKPNNEYFEKPPLIIKAHSGPTSHFNGALNSEVQYWTSKGWFYAEVNYAGSSGFGKEYIDRLNNSWGIADSKDCCNLVQDLIDRGYVDSSRVVIFGNSAGGFTALNSVANSDLFKACVCKYPVSDLNSMHLNTHRFERGYLDSLVGNYESCKTLYDERSPINNIDKIQLPTLFFHGKKDMVVSYNQTVNLYKKLLNKKKFSKLILFDDEGHGFKKNINKSNVLLQIENFLKEVFKI